jgi:hypothetical protein
MKLEELKVYQLSIDIAEEIWNIVSNGIILPKIL